MRMLVWVLMKHTKPKGFDVPANWRKHGLTDYELTPLAKKYPEQLYKALWKRWGTQGLGFSRDPSDREDACFEETGELSPLVNVVLACFLIVEERGEPLGMSHCLSMHEWVLGYSIMRSHSSHFAVYTPVCMLFCFSMMV